jgi:small subunit ribosomal protein S20
LVDKACRKGVMHKNAANRTKSRLAAKVNNLA